LLWLSPAHSHSYRQQPSRLLLSMKLIVSFNRPAHVDKRKL